MGIMSLPIINIFINICFSKLNLFLRAVNKLLGCVMITSAEYVLVSENFEIIFFNQQKQNIIIIKRKLTFGNRVSISEVYKI
jgi:hypothetical protein